MGVSKVQIRLVPWDPESEEHVERLYQQRVACTWKKEEVQSWRNLQRSGEMSIQWIVLSDANKEEDHLKIAGHLASWPLEASQIADTASSFGGKSRTPSPSDAFTPVGHISLDVDHEDASRSDVYQISTFYVSTALQGCGIGGAAMDAVEAMATSAPLNAGMLTLYTGSNANNLRKDLWKAFGLEPPTHSNQDWYAKMGYEVYDSKDGMWSWTHSSGKVWWFTAVFMRKDLK